MLGTQTRFEIEANVLFVHSSSAGISPSGQLPVLEFDGKVLIESKVILSFVAKEHSKYHPR